MLAVATRELIRGQSADTAFELRDDVTLGECLEMAWGKTAALMSASAVIGATLAGAPTPVRDALGVFGGNVGLAFQLVTLRIIGGNDPRPVPTMPAAVTDADLYVHHGRLLGLINSPSGLSTVIYEWCSRQINNHLNPRWWK